MQNRPHILFKMLILITLISIGTEISAQGWLRHFGTGQDDRSTSILQTRDGGYFVAGYSFDQSTNNQNQYLFKTDPNGNLQWDRITGPFIIKAAWHAIELDQGELMVAGENFVNSTTKGDVYLAKVSAAGDSLWNQRLPIPNFQRGEFLLQTQNKGYLVVGISQDFGVVPGDQDLFIVRMDSLGDTLWTRQYGGPGNDEGVAAVPTSDGGYAVVGALRDAPGIHSDFYLVRIDSTGDSLWTRSYSKSDLDYCTGITSTQDGGFLLAGYSVTDLLNNVIEEWVVRVDSAGDTLWTNLVGTASSGGENQTIAQLPNGDFALCSYNELIRIDSSGNTLWNRSYPGYVITDFAPTADGGFILTGTFNNPPFGNDLFLMKTDGQGIVFSNLIQGRVYRDQMQNCQFDPGDSALANWLVRAEPGGWTTTTDSNGYYEFVVDTGTTTVEVIPVNGYWAPDCPLSGQQTLQFSTPYDTTDGIDFALEPIVSCPLMRVNLGTPFLRPCFNNNYVVSWCNDGTLPADSVFITVELDTFLTVDSTQLNFRLPQTGNTYIFDIGTVNPGECGSFMIYCTLSCQAEMGRAHCSQATISPDLFCLPPDTSWDSSSVAVEATCDLVQNEVVLTVRNVGTAAMSSPGGLMVLEDDILKVSRNFQFGIGQDTVIRQPANGSTWVLIADQVPGHPGFSRPIIAMEGCGVDSIGDFSRGFLVNYPTDDANPWIDIDCRENGAAFDPNIKTAHPRGHTAEHEILYNHDLEYTIHFQNTGTDTAFTVIVRDTLPAEVNLNTLQLGVASHPYSFRIYGQRIAEWTFDNILLPDSNRNEPASHGFLTFRIEQRQVNEPGTKIENRAGIWFDYNPPIITPEAYHLVVEEKEWGGTVFIDPPVKEPLPLTVYPNPFRESTTFDLGTWQQEIRFEMWDLKGQKVREENHQHCSAFLLERKDLKPGIYVFRILQSDGAMGSGRIVIR